MAGDLRQVALGPLAVSVSTQPSDKHTFAVLWDDGQLARDETVSCRHETTGRWDASDPYFCHKSLGSLHNSIDAAEPDFAIPYSELDSGS